MTMSDVPEMPGREGDRLPVGLLSAMAQNMRSFEIYAGLSANGRRELRRQAENCQSTGQIQLLVNNMEDLRDL